MSNELELELQLVCVGVANEKVILLNNLAGEIIDVLMNGAPVTPKLQETLNFIDDCRKNWELLVEGESKEDAKSILRTLSECLGWKKIYETGEYNREVPGFTVIDEADKIEREFQRSVK